MCCRAPGDTRLFHSQLLLQASIRVSARVVITVKVRARARARALFVLRLLDADVWGQVRQD